MPTNVSVHKIADGACCPDAQLNMFCNNHASYSLQLKELIPARLGGVEAEEHLFTAGFSGLVGPVHFGGRFGVQLVVAIMAGG